MTGQDKPRDEAVEKELAGVPEELLEVLDLRWDDLLENWNK